MSRIRFASLAIALAFPVGSVAAQGSPTLDAVAAALGGKDRILGVRTLVIEMTGDNFNFGQNHTPSAPLPRFEVTQARRRIDFANKRWFLEQTRVPRFVTGVTTPQRQRFGLDGDVAYNVAPNDSVQRASAQVASDRAKADMMLPIGFVQAAYAPGAQVREETAGSMNVIHLETGGNRFAMFVDASTNLPVRIQTMGYNNVIGDVDNKVELANWQDVDGIRVAMRVTEKVDTVTTADYRISAARVNADVGDLAAPSAVRTATAPTTPAPNVVVEEIAPGVWLLAGQSHHTVAIEQSDGIILVEAPQNDARTLAVLAKARELRPGKPLLYLINTHHHFDHSGGVRAAVSEGLTLVTHDGNRNFYERTVYPRRHTIVRDALTRNPKSLRLLPVRDRWIADDSLRRIETYALEGNDHSGTMLVVYLPAQRLLIQADLYSPPAPNATVPPNFPFTANLLQNIARRGLQVDRVVGIHGRPVPLSDLQAAVNR